MGKFILICSSLMAVFAEAFYLVHALSPVIFLVTALSLVVSYGLFALFNRDFSLILVVLEVLGLGFWLVFEAWLTGAKTMVQAQDVAIDITLSATIIFLWLSARYIKGLFAQNVGLQEEILSLKKHDEQTGVLTFNEFQYRFESIWVGLRRRNEVGFFLKISLPPFKYTQRSILGKVTQSALDAIRSHYDIVGVTPNEEIYIVLQNTTEQGVDIVERRFFKLLSRTISGYIAKGISVECAKIDLTFSDAESWLNYVMGKEQLVEQERHRI
ncbi:hypothetical protein [Alicyclobacillus fodiniaquatilis]|uniref:GGDEF domain-containing protein n=1 Tax=Alicyclobacillus fodiniaquatilis TaxID=1661150 RepID=A0ABW4JLI9_9BACL